MIFAALEDVGGIRYLSRQAIENPVSFMSLLGRILPTTVANADGSALSLHMLAAKLVSEEIIARQAELANMPAQPQTIDGTVSTNVLDAPLPTE